MNTDLAPRPVARVYALPLVTSPASFFSSPDILDYTGTYSGGQNYRNVGNISSNLDFVVMPRTVTNHIL